MSAKKLEDFINLIETAEKISVTNDVPPLQLNQKFRSPLHQSKGGTKNNDFLNSSQSSVGSQPKVPNIKIPSWTPTPTPHRFVGPANSHCGLSMSDMSFNSPVSAAIGNDASISSRPISSRQSESHRSELDSHRTEKASTVIDMSTGHQLPTTVRRSSSASQHSDIIVNLQKNSPFVRKISQDMHPASPDRSPLTQRRSSRNSSSSPEKVSNGMQAKLPPRNPRFSLSGRTPSSGRQASRHSSSSPEKIPKEITKKGSTKSRTMSSSPSPVRSSVPKPISPSLSRSYSSSFGSSSASSSPSKSPLKSGSSKKSFSIKTEGNESASSQGSAKSQESKVSVTSKRKSWVAASLTARSHNSKTSDQSNESGEDIPDIEVKIEPNETKSSAKKENKYKRPIKTSIETTGKISKAKVAIDSNPTQKAKPVFRKRPQSAPNKKPVKVKPPEKAAELGEFSKSLKLLGIDVPSNRTEASKLCNQELKVQTKEPTIRTRLMKRSGSYADLTRTVKKDMKRSEFEAVKSDLNNAIFEEWYFKKCEKAREEKQKQKEEEERIKKEEMEKKKEIEEQSKEEFEKWKKQKKKQAEKDKKRKEIIERGKSPVKVIDKEEIERKNKEWLDLKKKDISKKKEADNKKRKEEEEKRIEEDKKRTDAQKTFLAWKDKKTQELKERYLNEKKKQKEMEEALLEKRKDADAAFNGWKTKKTTKHKDKRNKQEVKEESKETKEFPPEHLESTNKKLEEARMAYEAWLDFIEAREEEKFMFEEERKRILMWKPPWYPGGKALF